VSLAFGIEFGQLDMVGHEPTSRPVDVGPNLPRALKGWLVNR